MYAPGRFRESLRTSLTPVADAPEPSVGRPAAVLLPVIDGDATTVVFTKRTDELPRHPGEISFPGGLRHEEDADLLITALRETEEELGLSRDHVDVLGALEPLETFTTGFTIVPFVGALPAEIAEVFDVPVSVLLDIEQPKSWTRDGGTWWGYVYEVDGHTIWGATARILHEFLELIKLSDEEAM